MNTDPLAALGTSDDPTSRSLPRLRIFVSSPGDVDTERQIAGRVIERLRVGVGKSSLVRAGILPLLVEPGNGIALWRRASVRPSESAGDLFDGLAHALCAEEALPELVSGELTLEAIADFLRRNPAGIEFGISSALDRASAELKRQEELDLQAQEQSFRYHGRIADADAALQKIAELRKGHISKSSRFGHRSAGRAVHARIDHR